MILAEFPAARPLRFSDPPPSLLQNVKRVNFMDLKGKILYIFGHAMFSKCGHCVLVADEPKSETAGLEAVTVKKEY